METLWHNWHSGKCQSNNLFSWSIIIILSSLTQESAQKHDERNRFCSISLILKPPSTSVFQANQSQITVLLSVFTDLSQWDDKPTFFTIINFSYLKWELVFAWKCKEGQNTRMFVKANNKYLLLHCQPLLVCIKVFVLILVVSIPSLCGKKNPESRKAI